MRQSALITALVTLVMAAIVIVNYCRATAHEGGAPDFAVTELSLAGEPGPDRHPVFSVGLDGLSVWLFGLAALLTFTAVLVSWESIADRPVGFYSMLLLLETGMLGVFCRPRHHFVLHLLRVHADSAVFPDRHLGQRRAALRGGEVFPVHVRRQRAHVSRAVDDCHLAIPFLAESRIDVFHRPA